VGRRGSHAGAYRGHLIDRPNLGTALDREAVTDLCTDLGSAPKNVLEFLQRGMQIGWLDADSVIDQDGLDYLAIRDHLYQVGRSVLARLSNLDDMADGERREYFRDAHGLLASMTALLDRVGVDTTIQLRFPDGEAARTNENVRRRGLVRLRTRRRNSRAYGRIGWRQVVESRPDSRRPPADGYRPDRPHRRSDGVGIIGDGMDGLRDDVVAALDDVEPRDAIRMATNGYRDRRRSTSAGRTPTRRPSKRTDQTFWNTIHHAGYVIASLGALMGVVLSLAQTRDTDDTPTPFSEWERTGPGLDLRMNDVRAGGVRARQ